MNRIILSFSLLAAGIVLIAAGLMRGEGAAVLARAIKICFECIGLG